MEKTYNPTKHEDKIYALWEESGFFNPDECVRQGVTKEDAESFSVLMPPPNVTGVLHLGHAMENALMDTTARFRRMQGKRTLYLPGADHAAVATQARVEKKLIEEEGIQNPREELGREELLRRIREYADASKETIQKQVRAMGSSCDWSRFAYTFDKNREQAVNAVFKKMYDDGLIYRGYRTVNWSVKGQSTCSDDEIEHTEREAKLYTFRYAKDFPIPIATTRPETKLGDTAVAVHPKHPKYAKYIGKQYEVEVGSKEHPVKLTIHIIADEAADPEFGTGAVGVTPAHSQTDFEICERHPEIGLKQVIGKDGRVLPTIGKAYEGLTAEKAREQFIAWLKEADLLEKEETILQNVGTSDRFKDVIEVLPMKQWFIAVNKKIPGRGKTLKELMQEAVTIGLGGYPDKKVVIQPERFTKNYLHWIENLRDWCISRQIWWGHRIPVFYCRKKQGISNLQSPISKKEKCEEVIVSVEKITKCPHCGGSVAQDPDTLDTWFSSGLWTFSTLGYPDMQAQDFKTYHPVSWMQMGRDILFFWMARMVLMTTYTLDTIPFKQVYFHGMLKNKDGKKFSKSLGTGIDPLEVKKQYGADALRLSLLSDITPGNDPRFYDEKVEGSRNLVNKIWNISRYALTNANQTPTNADMKAKSPADNWVLYALQKTIHSVTKNLETSNFSLAIDVLRDFTWNDFADWYVEVHKIEKNDAVLRHVFETLLKLWHPFMPFVTETLFSEQQKNANPKNLLMVQKWPSAKEAHVDKDQAKQFENIRELITAIRSTRSAHKIDPQTKLTVSFQETNKKIIESRQEILKRLARLEEIQWTKTAPKNCVAFESAFGPVFLHLESVINLKKERVRLQKEIETMQSLVKNTRARLDNPAYREKAPKHIVEESEKLLQEYRTKLQSLENHLGQLS